ncbi:hypothetical protein [Isoptericola sp. NPDC057391]|uniref:hypothetical protein n=1 Tax=Isoptericola sp. NPDC057391 TaxID=3346117 RepID=UPI0036305F08
MPLEGESLEAILADARRAHGPGARIVSAERVITGGFRGLFGRQHFEAVVEVDDDAALPRAGGTGHVAGPVTFPAARRPGIAALLEEADGADRLRPSRAEDLTVSTGGEDFAALLDELVAGTGPAAPRPGGAAPAAPGDLVLLVGAGDAALRVAPALADGLGVLVAHAAAGARGDASPGTSRAPVLDGGRAATEARAQGVRAGAATVVVAGTGATRAPGGAELRRAAADLGPEHVWAVVDASRKPGDTLAWLDAVRRYVAVDAVVVVGRGLTATPETVDDLDLPVVWDAG